jgi:acetyl esterase/lipase
LSLDLYIPKNLKANAKAKVLIMIHGGGWCIGDKANRAIVGSKMNHFVNEGYIFASINYRLSHNDASLEAVKHPVHVEDCAKAVAWIHSNIEKYGGDSNCLHLMGHSSGAHLAALLATNDRFLRAEKKSLSILKSNVLLDTAAIDIPAYLEMANGRGLTRMYERAFGHDPADLRDASPQQHIQADKGIPPTLLFYCGERMELKVLGPKFEKALQAAGVKARAIDTISLSHSEMNSNIGMVNEPMTKLIMGLHAGEDANRFPGTIAKIKKSKPATRPTSQPNSEAGPKQQ